MNRDRAAEIIAAYGGDPARWPVAERAEALQLTLDDSGLGAARREASALDALLAAWASEGVGGSDAQDAAEAAAARVLAPVARRGRALWLAAGSAFAAAVALVVAVVTPLTVTPSPAPILVSDDAAFAMLFTPTNDEDGSI